MGLLQYKGFQCVWDGTDHEGPLSTSCAARQLYSPNQKQPSLLGLKSSHLGLSLCLILWNCPLLLPGLSPHSSLLSSLISSLFVFRGHIYSLWGGSSGEEEEGKGEIGGGRRVNSQIKDRCWKAFFPGPGRYLLEVGIGNMRMWSRQGKPSQLCFLISSVRHPFQKGSE